MGNICRSPTAEAVFRHQVKTAGFEKVVHVDSAGTHDFHAGESPDGRAQNAAIQRGYDMKKITCSPGAHKRLQHISPYSCDG